MPTSLKPGDKLRLSKEDFEKVWLRLMNSWTVGIGYRVHRMDWNTKYMPPRQEIWLEVVCPFSKDKEIKSG